MILKMNFEKAKACYIGLAAFILLIITGLCFVRSPLAGFIFLLIGLPLLATAIIKLWYFEKYPEYIHQSHPTTQRQTFNITIPSDSRPNTSVLQEN